MKSLLTVCILWALGIAMAQTTSDKPLDQLFSPGVWGSAHCDLSSPVPGVLEATLWKGYGVTGFETVRWATTDWGGWRSFRFEVQNPYPEPISVYVRISNQASHPAADTYTGGTFDGFVIGPGRNTVDISLERMKSREERPVDPSRIAYLGIFFQPLFLRDGMHLVFPSDKTLRLSNPRLSRSSAKLQAQPYGDLLFGQTVPELELLRRQVEQAIRLLEQRIAEAKTRNVETGYAEIYPFLARVAFGSRLAAFWQDRSREQRSALEFLLAGAGRSASELQAAMKGQAPNRLVPLLPDYSRIAARDGYFRVNGDPVLLFGMLYNREGPLLRWFANSETDYGTQLVAGGTRQDVERQPIWDTYHRYPETHRVGWDHADHIIRDRSSWEVVGEPVNLCLESPHSREAVAKMIENFERAQAYDRDHLVQNLGYEYTYVCYCDYTRRMWADWVRRKHPDLASANRIWGTQYESFDAVPMPRPENAARSRALWFDWASFNLYRFLEQVRWTRDQIRRWEPSKPLTVGSPYFAFDPSFWTGVDEEELADSGITDVILEENYELDTLMPEYLHALARGKPVADFEYHGVVHQILPSFLHGDAAISMWWWNDRKHWTPNEPINEWASSFPQSYTIPLADVGKAMRDALDLRRLSREIAALGSAPRPVALLYSKTSMLQQLPRESAVAGASPYLSELRRVYSASQPAGLYVGFTTEKKILAGDLQTRKILLLTGAEFLPEAVNFRILRWVEAGGTLIVSPDSMLADEYARPFNTLATLGIRVVRREAPPLKRGERVVTEYNLDDLPRLPLRINGSAFSAAGASLEGIGSRQILQCNSDWVAARFPDKAPALLRIPRGRGTIYWLAAPLNPRGWPAFLSTAAQESGLEPELRVTAGDRSATPEVEYRITVFEGHRLGYLYNCSDRDTSVTLRPAFPFSRILDRRAGTRLRGPRLLLPARETAILEFE